MPIPFLIKTANSPLERLQRTKEGQGSQSRPIHVDNPGFKDQWDRMRNSFLDSGSGKVQQTSAFTMRAIRLVIAPLHPIDQRQFQLLGPMP
jgi:hypothetical protein